MGWGGLPEGIMRYYHGRDYQVDLFTKRCPHDELGGLKNAIELMFFEHGCFLIAAQQQYPMLHFLPCYFLSQVCANWSWGRDVVRPEEQTQGICAWNIFTSLPTPTLKKLKTVRRLFWLHMHAWLFSMLSSVSERSSLDWAGLFQETYRFRQEGPLRVIYFLFFSLLKALLCYVLLMPLRWFGLTFADAPGF